MISVRLESPIRSESRISEAIRELGVAAQVHPNFWYVNTTQTAREVCDYLWQFFDERQDSLFVVDATNRQASWNNLDDEPSSAIKNQWYR